MLSLEPIRGTWTLEETERALMEVAVCGGNCALASQRLAASGVVLNERTLRRWSREMYPGRYERVQLAHAAAVEERLTTQARDAALLACELEREAMEAALVQVRAGEARDPAGVARNAAVTKGINVDQVLKLTGRPTEITEVRSAEQIMRALASKLGVRGVVDGSVEDDGQAELLPAA